MTIMACTTIGRDIGSTLLPTDGQNLEDIIIGTWKGNTAYITTKSLSDAHGNIKDAIHTYGDASFSVAAPTL